MCENGNNRVSVDDLLEQLSSGDAESRAKAAFDLGLVGDERVTPALVKAAYDSDADVRSLAVLGLRCRPKTDYPKIRRALLDRLECDSEPTTRSQAVMGLNPSADTEALDALIKALDDSDSMVRRTASCRLSLRQDPVAIEKLWTWLDDPDWDIRLHAASWLTTLELTDSRVVVVLEGLMNTPASKEYLSSRKEHESLRLESLLEKARAQI